MTNGKIQLRTGAALGLILVLAACDGQPLDFDLRPGGFSTADAARSATTNRPKPDNRGVISYPGYQVAVAQRGDTLEDVAARVDLPVEELARFNGISPDVPLRQGEIVALPRRVAEPSPATGAVGTGPILPPSVDVTTLASDAIDNAPATPVAQPRPTSVRKPQTGEEPIRHKVERGETAYTIARLYQVPVRSLAQWNGLGPDFGVREGQYLLIPVARAAPPQPAPAQDTVPAPGTGSPTPTPPRAAKPLPQDDNAKPLTNAAKKPAVDVGKTTKATTAKMAFPVQGSIIREYAKNRNEGIDIKAAPGASVKAADNGTVAAITKSADGIPIVVVRHADNLLTVYANVTDVSVRKGDEVRRGQGIARLRAGNDAYVHFEVRKGFDSVDPIPFLR